MTYDYLRKRLFMVYHLVVDLTFHILPKQLNVMHKAQAAVYK
jgi:hypothetical protein